MAHWSDGKSCKQVSESDFTSSSSGDFEGLIKRSQAGSLIRIAVALERIASRLDCNTTANAARALIRMDKRMSKRYPLR